MIGRGRGDQRHNIGIDTAGGEEREKVGHEIAEERADEIEPDGARPENRQPAAREADGEQRQGDAADRRRGDPAIGETGARGEFEDREMQAPARAENDQEN